MTWAILRAVLRWSMYVTAALWLGGVVGIGAFTAPQAFQTLESTHMMGGVASAKLLAGQIIGGSLRKFNVLCIVCGTVLSIGTIVERVSRKPLRAWQWAVSGSAIATSCLLLTSVFYLNLVQFPALDCAQASGNMEKFDRLHKGYENISYAQLPFLLFLFMLWAITDVHITNERTKIPTQ